jgi:hypothetical protein
MGNIWVFREDVLVKMIKKSKGRRIVFEYTGNPDEILYHYEAEKGSNAI